MLFLFFLGLLYEEIKTKCQGDKSVYFTICTDVQGAQKNVKIKKKNIQRHKNGLNKKGFVIDISHRHYPSEIEEGEHKLCSFCMKYMAKWTFGCDKCDVDACQNCVHHLSKISSKIEMLPDMDRELYPSHYIHQIDIKCDSAKQSFECSNCGEEKSGKFVKCSHSECSHIMCKGCEKNLNAFLRGKSFEHKFKKEFYKDVVAPLGWTKEEVLQPQTPPPPQLLEVTPLPLEATPLPSFAEAITNAVEEIRKFQIASGFLN
uniref:Uncharacterized protein n=1 Tax=viral metagenome TaxID=1070528 RepID=A0A6C0BEG5_9ZZZZ